MGNGELELLREIRRRVRRTGDVALGIGDDCALLRPGRGEEIAVTTDLSIDGRHFRLGWHPAEAVGHRTLARGLSDLAAMGARPLAAFVSLGLPKELVRTRGGGRSWVSRFYDGLLALADAYGTPLAGGDLAESPVAVADIVLVGGVPKGRALLRSGAKAGDEVYVTGALGGSAAGLVRLGEFRDPTLAADKSRKDGARDVPHVVRKIPARLAGVLAAHLYPQPRVAQGWWLRERKLATAAIDLSDGLSTDLLHLCEESGVAAEVDATMVPLGMGAGLEQALHGGEDYELLFTAPAGRRVPAMIEGVAVTRIGRMVRARRGAPVVTLVAANGRRELTRAGWEHFV